MESESLEEQRGFNKASLLKIGALAVGLGVATWLAAPYLLPPKLPPDFPQLPDLNALNPSAREALQRADRDARRKPGSAEIVGRLGMAYQANTLLEPAARAYRIAARLAPEDYQWPYCQAFVEEEKGNQTEQFRLLKQTLKLKPDHALSLLKLGDALLKLERLDEAEHYYSMAARSAGAALQANYGLGRVAARRQDWDKVIAYVAPLTQTNPELKPPFALLETAYRALGQPDRAAEVKQGGSAGALSVMPPLEDPLSRQLNDLSYSSTRLLKQAGLLNQLGQPDRALQLARRAAEAEPKDADVHLFLARTLLNYYPGQQQMTDEALTRLGEGLRLRPEDPGPLWMFAQDFLSSPKAPASVERLAALMRPYAGREDAHLYLGMLATVRGDTNEAVAQYQAALKDDFSNSAVLNNIGAALERAGRSEEALAYFRKAVKANPENPTARFTLGLSLLQGGNRAEGMKELSEALRLKPEYADAHFSLGFALLDARKPEDAIARFRQGLRYRPDGAEGHFGLGAALAMQRKREEAIAELRQTLRLNPQHAEAQAMLQQLMR